MAHPIRHSAQIHAERLRPDGDFEYRYSTSRHFELQSARGLTDRQVQEYRERMIDNPRAWERDFEVERITGHDDRDTLVIFKPHYQTGLEVRPGWFRHSVVNDELKREYGESVVEADKAYAVMKEEKGAEAAQAASKVAILMQHPFQAHIPKPVGAKLREVVLERYPEAFRYQDMIEGRNATAPQDPSKVTDEGDDERASTSQNKQKSEEPIVPFYNMTTGIIGEDETHYLFLNTSGSARWVPKEQMYPQWTEPYKKQKEQLIEAFQAYTGGEMDYQGKWRPDLHLHGMEPVFLVIATPVSAAVKEEVDKRYPGLLVPDSEVDAAPGDK